MHTDEGEERIVAGLSLLYAIQHLNPYVRMRFLRKSLFVYFRKATKRVHASEVSQDQSELLNATATDMSHYRLFKDGQQCCICYAVETSNR